MGTTVVKNCGAARHVGSAPFVHRFETKANKYLFDVNSAEILRTDDVVWEIVEDSHLSEDEVLSKYASKFTCEQISTAYHEIQEMRDKEELLLGHHPTIEMRHDKARVDELLDGCREQLILNVTERCNFRCAYCPFTAEATSWRDHGARDMSWETARQAIDDFLAHCKDIPSVSDFEPSDESPRSNRPNPLSELSELDVRPSIGFYGGEPLLVFPLIKKCTEYIRAHPRGKMVALGITTNGYLLTREVVEFLVKYDFSVRVSLDGSRDIHDKHRRTASGEPTWAAIVENVKAVYRRYPDNAPWLAATVAATTDLRDVAAYFASADWIPPHVVVSAELESEPDPGYYETRGQKDRRPRGYNELYATYIGNVISSRINAIWDREIMIQRAIFDPIFIHLHRKRRSCREHRRLPDSFAPFTTCVAGSRRTFVSTSGDYYPCERIPQIESYRVGHASTGVDADQAYVMMKDFTECTHETCKNCWCLPICSVGCFANVREKTGFTKSVKEKRCEVYRKWLHARFVDYCGVLEKNPNAFDYFAEMTIT